MHKKIFFLGATLFFCGGAIGSVQRRPISPKTRQQSDVNNKLRESVLGLNVSQLLKALQEGAQVNACLPGHNLSLHLVTKRSDSIKNRDSAIKALLEHKADLNLQNEKGETALLNYVIHNSNPSMLTYLLDAKADPTIADHDGHTPLSFARKLSILNAFFDKGFLPYHTPLTLAIKHLQPHLLPFIPVKPLTEIIVSYLVEKETDHA